MIVRQRTCTIYVYTPVYYLFIHLRTFYDQVEDLWLRVALTLNGARVLAVVRYVHFLNLKAVLVFIPNAGHNGDTWVHRPLVVPCEYDAGAVQPGSFRDPIQQVAPTMTRDISVGSGQILWQDLQKK